MLVVPLLWLVRWLARGRLTRSTPLDLPLLIMAAMTAVSLWATFDLRLSFPKLCGVFLGIALFYALVNGVRTERCVWLATGLILTGGAAVAGLSLVGAQWPGSKVPLLSPLLDSLYRRLPALIRGVPRAEAGFSTNQVGGTLALFIPLAAALVIHRLGHPRRAVSWILSALGLAGALGLSTFVLLLTQSRQAYLSTSLALLLLAASQGRWPRVVAIVALALGVGLLAYYGPHRSAQAIFGVRDLEMLAGYASWAGRVEIWKRALRAIRGHPLTGIGFDTLFPVIHARYPTFLIAPGRDLTHAHNVFLQTALDLGLPGLVAFVWLLLAFGRMLWQVQRRSVSSSYAALAIGLLFGLLAQLFFGLADAIALGQKPGVFTWAYLGLGAALWANQQGSERAEEQRRWRDEQTGRQGEGGTKGTGATTTANTRRAARNTHHTSRLWPWIVAALVVLSLAAWGYTSYARARTRLSVLRADLRRLQALAQEGPQAVGPWRPEELLHQTRSDLLGLRSDLALPLALAPHLGWLPGCGADLKAAPILLRMGIRLTDAGVEVAKQLRPLLTHSEEPTGDEGALERTVEAVENARPQLAHASAILEQVRRDRRAIRTADLSPQMRQSVARLDQGLAMLEDALRGAMVVPELLGASEPRTYLILIQNDDELRPTGGFISGVARVVVEEGRIAELIFEDSYAVDNFSEPYPAPPAPLREIMGSELWLFRDSNWSPDFPTSAQMAVKLYRLHRDEDVDGVLALDQQAIRVLVTALQPVDVVGHPEPVTGENVIQEVRQSWAPPEEGVTDEWWRQRKGFMGHLITAAVRKLQEEPGQVNLIGLGWATLRALEERHLFVYVSEGEAAASSVEPSAADVMHRAGWDGALQEVRGDYLMVVDANLGFNKADPLVTEGLTYTVDLRDPARPRAALALVHQHTGAETGTPCRHEPRYDLTYEGMMQRCYWDYLRVYVPGGSRLSKATPHPVPGRLLVTGKGLSGEARVLPEEAGKAAFATLLVLAPGERAQSDFLYDLPARVVERSGDTWRYRLYIQKQGGATSNQVDVALKLPAGAEVVAASPPPIEREGDVLLYDLQLRADVELEVQIRASQQGEGG